MSTLSFGKYAAPVKWPYQPQSDTDSFIYIRIQLIPVYSVQLETGFSDLDRSRSERTVMTTEQENDDVGTNSDMSHTDSYLYKNMKKNLKGNWLLRS